MCGIAGLVLKNNAHLDIPKVVRDMTGRIQHRGPDGEGFYFFENVGLGHRRLAIIDRTSNGHQPMFYLKDRFVITYNGEVYNYIELRRDLEKLGFIFTSGTDTEVILAAYAQWGESCVKHFNGMWAFAIFDKVEKTLFCSRDRFGVKPFYYVNTPELFAFGSEIKQLLPLIKRHVANQTCFIDFLLTGATDHNQDTFFAGVLKLSGGNNLFYCLDKNDFRIHPYYRVSFNQKISLSTQEEAVERYMSLLEDAIKLRLRADVTVGTSLSGGLDSSTIASIAAPIYQSMSGKAFHGITAISEQESNNEADYARQVVGFSNMNGLTVRPDYSSFIESLPHVVLTQEEPFGSPSVTMQYFVMKTAREHGIPVLLDGQGGDETLLGYDKYYANYLVMAFQQQGVVGFISALRRAGKNNSAMTVPNAMKYLVGGASARLRFQYYCYIHRYLLNRPICSEHLIHYSRSMFNTFDAQKFEIERLPIPCLLRCEDKNSMAHSIETRLPFLDYRLVEMALSLPAQYKIKDGWSKWLLRKGMENRMPKTIVWRKNKLGFEAPESIWLKQHFNEMSSVVMSSNLLREVSKPDLLKKNYGFLDYRSQWRLYSIALWEKLFNVVG